MVQLAPIIWPPRRRVLELLSGSQFGGDIPYVTKAFDEKTKLSFGSPDFPHFIKFGRVNDNAKELGVKAGQLKLLG